ncbi:hypothetical protein MJO29_014805 [Puccinia striiformis f. sp. tritici]|nr:hypothetical protein MJO29_014805 [Puccinia striiformis f. sp. tritici]
MCNVPPGPSTPDRLKGGILIDSEHNPQDHMGRFGKNPGLGRSPWGPKPGIQGEHNFGFPFRPGEEVLLKRLTEESYKLQPPQKFYNNA